MDFLRKSFLKKLRRRAQLFTHLLIRLPNVQASDANMNRLWRHNRSNSSTKVKYKNKHPTSNIEHPTISPLRHPHDKDFFHFIVYLCCEAASHEL
jgi:hypothetical protein